MEKRQLNFNAPLLSARRFSSPRNSSELLVVPGKTVEKRAPSRPNKSNSELDDIIKPGAVPFHWEQTPGQPKNEAEARFPIQNTPMLPPGRANSGEHPKPRPGRLSGPSKFNPRPTEQTLFSDHASLLEKLHESFKCKDESESSETENDEDAYSDAINVLSLDEPCSVSGISGSHDNRPSGTFSVDKQTRDFMMSRFLPAAKAVAALESPQYAAKKAAVVRPTGKRVVEEMKKNVVKEMARKYGSAEVLPYYGKDDFDNVESNDDDEDGERGRVAFKKAGKSWGIIPRLCVKSTLCLLNPLPGLKSKSRPTTPKAGEEKRLRRNAVSGPLDKNGWHLPPSPKKKHHSGLLLRDLGGPHSNSIKPSSSHDSPLRRYCSGSLSPCRNKPPTFLPKEIDTKIASSRKMFKALRDVSRNQAAEKTVYVDSVGKTVEKMVGSKYTDEAKDVGKYFSVGGGLRVKEGIEGLGDGGGDGDGDGGGGGGEWCKVGLKNSPLSPPLPKSPSESWLWRTLPFGQLKRNGQVQRKKAVGGDDTKWETIVKSSNLRHDYARYSEELMPYASYKQSKS